MEVPNADQGSINISRVLTRRFFYNSDLGKMYVGKDGYSNWRYLDPNGSWAKTGVVMPAGEKAFEFAYNMRFYDLR